MRLCFAVPVAVAVATSAAPPLFATDEALEIAVARMARVGSAFSPTFSPDGFRCRAKPATGPMGAPSRTELLRPQTPDGPCVAFVSNLGGLPQVWVVPVEGGFPEAVTALEDPVGNVEWSPDGSHLAFTVAPGGGVNEQVWVVRPDGSGLRRLTAGGKETNRFFGWASGGRELAMGSNERDGRTIDAFVVDLATGARRGATKGPGLNSTSDVSRDGRRAVVSRLLSRGDNDLFLVDLATGDETLLTPHEKPGSFFGGQFAPDGRAIYLGSNQQSDLLVFARIALDAGGWGRRRPLATEPPWDRRRVHPGVGTRRRSRGRSRCWPPATTPSCSRSRSTTRAPPRRCCGTSPAATSWPSSTWRRGR